MATYPYEVGFPVKFYSGGDTTKEAFNKHIQEIERIYGILNALNADKLSASEFTTKLNAHINDSNPHPNLDLSNTKGNIPFSRISGSLDGSRITGTLSSSVIPTLSTSKISGLESYVKNLTPSNGIVNDILANNGYIKFANDLIMQWGRKKITVSQIEEIDSVSFYKDFSSACYVVMLTFFDFNGSVLNHNYDFVPQLLTVSKNNFTYVMQCVQENAYITNEIGIQYFAIGK